MQLFSMSSLLVFEGFSCPYIPVIQHLLHPRHRKQKNTLTLRMNASRKAREGRNTLVTRTFSPIQHRLGTRQEREGKTAMRSQRHIESVVLE